MDARGGRGPGRDYGWEERGSVDEDRMTGLRSSGCVVAGRGGTILEWREYLS
jgi:hypothetical protein